MFLLSSLKRESSSLFGVPLSLRTRPILAGAIVYTLSWVKADPPTELKISE